jgi:hypothetical protein
VTWAHPASYVSFTFSKIPFLLMLKYVLIMEITEYNDKKVNGLFRDISSATFQGYVFPGRRH